MNENNLNNNVGSTSVPPTNGVNTSSLNDVNIVGTTPANGVGIVTGTVPTSGASTTPLSEVSSVNNVSTTSVGEVSQVSNVSTTPVSEVNPVSNVSTAPVSEVSPVSNVGTTPVSEASPVSNVSATPVSEVNSVGNEDSISTNNNATPLSEVSGFDPSMVNNQVTSSSVEEDDEPRKKKGGILKILIILILLIGVGGFCFYKFVYSANVFKFIVSGTLNQLKENIVDSKTLSGDFSVNISGTSSEKSTNDLLKIFGNIDLSGKYGISYEDKIVNMNFDTKYKNKELINIDTYMENGVSYVLLDKIYDKYLKTPVDDYESLFENIDKKEDEKIILDGLQEAFDKSLKDEYVDISFEKVDDKYMKKSVLKLNKDVVNSISGDIANSLSNNDKFINSLAKISGEKVEDIKKEINNIDSISEFDDCDLIIYTSLFKSEFYKAEMVNKNEKIDIKNVGDGYEYSFSNKGKEITSGKISVGKDGNNSSIVLTSKISTNELDLDIKFNCSYSANGNISKKDVTGAVEVDDLTESDLEKANQSIMNNEAFKELVTDLSNALGIGNDDSLLNDLPILG